jgi:hypothetical protein
VFIGFNKDLEGLIILPLLMEYLDILDFFINLGGLKLILKPTIKMRNE